MPAERRRGAWALWVLAACLGGCAWGRQLAADPQDLADYRAFRAAADGGPRLARAQAYLEAHPRGSWAAEVRDAFEREEAAHFSLAQRSRGAAIAYLTDLPRGPHAAAVLAAIEAIEHEVADEELEGVVRAVRRREAQLEWASRGRKRVADRVLEAVGALLESNVYGAPIETLPAALRRALEGPAPSTWGAPPERRGEDLFFLLPSREGADSRYVRLEVEVVTERGRVIEGRVSGEDLFARWAEADELRSIDTATADGRTAAVEHTRAVLGGALEARTPEGRCAAPSDGEAILVRLCDGWEIRAVMAARAGEPDVVSIRGPGEPGEPRAPARGIR